MKVKVKYMGTTLMVTKWVMYEDEAWLYRNERKEERGTI